MHSIYDFKDYRVFLKNWIGEHSARTRGLQGKLAQAAQISSTLMSRILSGEKQLSLEQAAEIAEYIGLNESETEYFLILVEIGKAGSFKLKSKLISQADKLAQKVSVRISKTVGIDENIKAIYYSSWIYAGIRNLVATPGEHNVISVSQRLGLPKLVVANALEFLVSNGLCKVENNSITYSVQRTHLEADSPFINKHHFNWRGKALQSMEYKKDTNLFFTGPMSLSKEVSQEIRQMLPQFIEDIMKKVGPSSSELVYCLNIDWFEY